MDELTSFTLTNALVASRYKASPQFANWIISGRLGAICDRAKEEKVDSFLTLFQNKPGWLSDDDLKLLHTLYFDCNIDLQTIIIGG